jgi:hypothetical protein
MYQAGQTKKIGENIRAEETWVNYYKDGSMDKYYNFFLNKKSEVKEEAAIIVTGGHKAVEWELERTII